MKNLGLYLLHGNTRAVVVALLASLLPLMGVPATWIVGIVVALVTLSKGMKTGAMLLPWIALPAISLLVLGRVGIFDILLLSAILVWLFSWGLKRFGSWLVMLEISIIVMLLFVSFMHIVVHDLTAVWIDQFKQHMQAYIAAMSFEGDNKQLQQSFIRIAPFATGLVSLQLLLGVWLPTWISRRWQIVIGASDLSSYDARLRVLTLVVATALIVIIALSSKATLIDCMPIVGLFLIELLINLGRNLAIARTMSKTKG